MNHRWSIGTRHGARFGAHTRAVAEAQSRPMLAKGPTRSGFCIGGDWQPSRALFRRAGSVWRSRRPRATVLPRFANVQISHTAACGLCDSEHKPEEPCAFGRPAATGFSGAMRSCPEIPENPADSFDCRSICSPRRIMHHRIGTEIACCGA